MSLLIFILLLSVILVVINPSIVIALDMTNNEPGNNTDFGGLSAESTNIAETNKTDLMMDSTGDNTSFGGLSVESTDIAGANNKTDLINGTNNNNGTDFGGLSARSVNITK